MIYEGDPLIKVYLFDWGDTLMVDFPGVSGKMCNWDIVESVDGAKETLECLSQNAKIYIATGASESTENEIKIAFNRVGLDRYISGYFCKATVGQVKGRPEFLMAILSTLNIAKDSVAMVGDNFEKDILPSTAIGIRSFWLLGRSQQNLPTGCTQINNLLELCI